MQIMDLLGMYFDAAVVFFIKVSWRPGHIVEIKPPIKVEKVSKRILVFRYQY